MKAQDLFIVPIFAAFALQVFGQTNFLYDQQSAVEGARAEGGGTITRTQFSQPFGQSFTPTLTSVGFIRLWVRDMPPGNSTGSVVSVNLRMDSITGPILAATELFLPDGFGADPNNRGYPDFFFSSPVSVTPGVTYYFQVMLQSGDAMGVFGDTTYNYSGGTEIYQGSPYPISDLWFREGIIVPEPSVGWLALVGAGVLVGWRWRRRGQNRSLS